MKLLEFRSPKLLYFEKVMPLAPFKKKELDSISLRKAISPRDPNSVNFFLSPSNALEKWAKDIDLKPGDCVGLIAPYPKEFQKIVLTKGAHIRLLPRDPDDLLNLDFTPFKAIMLSNPNLADSFYYPDGIYQSLFAKFRSFPNLEILSEESLMEFFRHQEYPAPGSLAKFNHPKLSLLSGVYSFSADTLSWLVQPSRNALRQEITLRALPPTLHALLTLKEARRFKQFSKRLFVMEHNLLRFANDLRPALLTKKVGVAFWPRPRALYVMIDISKILIEQRCSVETWVKNLEQETGLLVDAGSHFGAPQSIRVCLAYGFRHLRKVTDILTKHLCSNKDI